MLLFLEVSSAMKELLLFLIRLSREVRGRGYFLLSLDPLLIIILFLVY